MSEAVRAAVAARRAAAARSRSTSPVKKRGEDDGGSGSGASGFGSFDQPFDRRGSPTLSTHSASSFSLAQKPEEDLLYQSCSSGKLNLSSRLPALTSLPTIVFSLLDGAPPRWYEDKNEQNDPQSRRPWYEREDLRILSVANGELSEISDRIGDFRGLSKLELQNNALTRIPATTFQLVNLTSLNLSRNGLAAIPASLLALDSLIDLDLSYNNLQSLWSDDAVVQARKDRKEWDMDNADEEDGVWAGFLERAGSPTKRVRPPPPTRQEEAVQPMRSLRTLKLAKNRLSNDVLFPSNTNRFTWPPNLVELDVSDNMIRGPLPLAFAANLKDLEVLAIGGNGITDDVFRQEDKQASVSSPFGPRKSFPSLQVLDLQRCEIDDLAPLEAFFGSARTHFGPDQDHSSRAKEVDVTPPPPAQAGLSSRSLVRIRLAQDAPRQQASDGSSPPLYVVLEGNPLREEAFKRKHGTARRAQQQPADQPAAAQPAAQPQRNSAVPSPPPTKAAASTSSAPSPSLPLSNTASTSGPQKEAWELEIEAGMYSEGAKRRMRAEAARAAAAAAAGSSGASPGLASPHLATPSPSSMSSSPSRTAARRQPDGINKTGLSDWDGSPSPSKHQLRAAQRGSQQQQQQQQQTQNGELPRQSIGVGGNGIAGHEGNSTSVGGGTANVKAQQFTGAGSTLANTKLTKRQSEALSRVPCKFFRSANGCSAGDACPFAHVQPGSGGGGDGVNGAGGGMGGADGTGSGAVGMKSVCEFFIKGNCRFGHKCALAHVREGEPMSMDRKNKKAAQQGQKGGVKTGGSTAATPDQQQQQQQQNQIAGRDRNYEFVHHQQQQQHHPQHRYNHQQQQQQFLQPVNTLPPQQQPQYHMQYLAQQQPQFPPPPPPTNWPTAYPPTGTLPPHEDFSFGVPDDMQALDGGLGASSSHRASLTGSSSSNAAAAAAAGPSHRNFIGSPPSTRAFGSSPFGQSVFYSGSQESEGGAGPFARSAGSAGGSHFAARSLGTRNGSFSGSNLRPRMSRVDERFRHSGGAFGQGATDMEYMAGDDDVLEDDDEGDDGHNEEDFLPSSLSDLLTPAELERRKRSAAMGAAGRPGALTQSMPAAAADGAAAFQASMMDLGRRGTDAAPPAALHNQRHSFVIEEVGEEPTFNFEKRSTHAPGQSLPHGLAAGLSRLHLAAASGQDRLTSGDASKTTSASTTNTHLGVGFSSSPRFGTSPSSSSLMAGHGGTAALGRTPPRQEFGPVGSPAKRVTNDVDGRNPALLDDYGLGPTAPSSVLPHRPGPLSSRLSSAFSFDGRGGSGVGSYSQSPAGVIGSGSPSSARSRFGGGSGSYADAAGIAIGGKGGSGVNANSAKQATSQHLHPTAAKSPGAALGAQRPSLSTSVAASSPLALPPSNGEGEEEVGVFELE